MASGTADRVDIASRIASAQNLVATPAIWEAAGVARTGGSSDDRFGEALTAARARDDAAARSRETAVRDRDRTARTDALRARKDAIREETSLADRTGDRGSRPIERPAAGGAKAADRADGPAPASRRDIDSPAASRETGPKSAAATGTDRADRKPSDPSGGADATAGSEHPRDASSAKTDPAKTDPAKTEKTKPDAATTETADATATQAAAGTPAALLALLAALADGGTVLAKPTGASADEAGAAGVGQTVGAGTATGTAAAPGAVAPATPPATGSAATGVSATPPSGGPGAAPVEGASAVHAGAATDASAAGKDFLAALTDAGQGVAQGVAPGTLQGPAGAVPQGGPDPTAGAAVASGGPQAAAAPAPQPAIPAQAAPAVPIGQVPMTIGLRSLQGSSAFQIRLDPAELGRIEVKLEIDKARGTVMTHLVVDRADTLALLQRDAGQLQQALSQTGLDPSGGGLNLSLRGDGGAQGDARGGQGGSSQGAPAPWTTEAAETPQETAPTRWLRGYGGLDIRI